MVADRQQPGSGRSAATWQRQIGSNLAAADRQQPRGADADQWQIGADPTGFLVGFSCGFLLDFSYGFFRWICVVGAMLSCSE